MYMSGIDEREEFEESTNQDPMSPKDGTPHHSKNSTSRASLINKQYNF